MPAARILSKNWNDSVQMVLGNLQVKILHRQKAGERLPEDGMLEAFTQIGYTHFKSLWSKLNIPASLK